MLWPKAVRLAVARGGDGAAASLSGRSVAIDKWRAAPRGSSGEACAVAAADGIALEKAAQWAIIEALPDDLTTSAARDAAAGGERLDAITGSVVRAGAGSACAPGARVAPRGGGCRAR